MRKIALVEGMKVLTELSQEVLKVVGDTVTILDHKDGGYGDVYCGDGGYILTIRREYIEKIWG